MPNSQTETQPTPVSLVLEDGQSVPVSVVLSGKDGEIQPLPVSLPSNEVVLSDSTVQAIAQAVTGDTSSYLAFDASLTNCCFVLLCVGVFACFGAICVSFLLDRLSIR